ncbi:MAG: peptidoglycan bridge formation glycyltransferase FemA/FemB family protein [Erysipelotrichales bacterium]|nr:peptidoglycan bridge formation glycyltransferase FemA/FemB family protein [Erysipelotrichales bacterium]MBQ2478750.1 peptidoglycan bridge formation glycyltransferase FemA/FemB family protein [Erysipelotrichales bacterium]
MSLSRYEMIFDADPSELDRFAENAERGSLLQESLWAKVKDNWDHAYILCRKDGIPAASAMVLIRKLAGPWKLFYIPRGPLLDYSDHELVRYFFAELKSWAKKNGAVTVRFDPLIVHDVRESKDDPTDTQAPDEVTEFLKTLGIKHHGYNLDMYAAMQPRTQAVVYFADEKPMGKKLRYYLKHAKSKGVEIVRMKTDGVDRFAELEEKTADRKGISLRNGEYFRKLTEVYGENANISLGFLNVKESLAKETSVKEQLEKQLEDPKYTEKKRFEIGERLSSVSKNVERLAEIHEKHGDTIWISGALIVRSGSYAELMYAGMDEEFEFYRSNATFQDAIDWAKENGCRYCNLGGVEGTLDDSLTMFKDLYGPRFESYIGEFDMPVRKVLAKGFDTALKIYKKI